MGGVGGRPAERGRVTRVRRVRAEAFARICIRTDEIRKHSIRKSIKKRERCSILRQ
jgi:hypothetical protein